MRMMTWQAPSHQSLVSGRPAGLRAVRHSGLPQRRGLYRGARQGRANQFSPSRHLSHSPPITSAPPATSMTFRQSRQPLPPPQ